MSQPRHLQAGELARVLPPGGLTLVSSCSAESDLLAAEVAAAGCALDDMAFSGIFVPGLNRKDWRAGERSRVLSFFMTPQLRELGDRLEFLPICYQDVVALYRARRPAAALFMCSPPDANGNCSFGTEVSFIADFWRDVPVRIAHINPAMPRTPGDAGIPFSELTAYYEGEQALRGTPDSPPDAVSQQIAAHILPYIEDGATLQTGLGKIPDAVLDGLADRRNLRMHTGLIGDGALRLVQSGAMADGPSALVGVAIGSEVLYAGLDNPHFQFRPISQTHDLKLLGTIDRLVTINSALEADLFGQVYAEITPKGAMSGPGGASDYARGGRLSPHGLRIIAFPSTAAKGTVSRIISPFAAGGPVSLSRWDVDLVVTEHGVADLRGKGYDARAEALIAIADPAHRDNLDNTWREIAARL